MKNRGSVLKIIYQESQRIDSDIYNKAGNSSYSQSLDADESICRMLSNYLRGKSDQLVDSKQVAKLIQTIESSKRSSIYNVISLCEGLELSVNNGYLVLEHFEPFENTVVNSWEKVTRLILNGVGYEIQTYCPVGKRKANLDTIFEIMPFDEKRLQVVIDYLNDVYNQMNTLEKGNHVKR